MVSREDILSVSVTDEMIFAGVEYAEKTLHYTFNRMGLKNHYNRIRNIVKGIVMERAFRALLDNHNVQYDLLGNTHWTKKDRYDVGIQGHRYDVKGFMVQDKATEIQEDTGWLLDCAALVPADQVESRNLKTDDYYVFPFMTGNFMQDIRQLYGFFSGVDFYYLIHSFWDYGWVKNEEWLPKGNISVESRMEKNFHMRIGGQGEDEELRIEEFDLSPGQELKLESEFFTVLFAQTFDIPSGMLHISLEGNDLVEEIDIYDWGNIWLYDGTVYQSGYISKGEFKEKSEEIPRFFKGCKQYAETKTVNRMMLISDLHPISDLFTGN